MNARQDFFPIARQIVERQQAAHTATWTGVHYSGPAPDAPRVETVENVALRLEREAQRIASWKITPRGRFYVCINDLRDTGAYADEAARLERWYLTSISDERSPLNVKAVATCLVILDGISTSTAREASAALHELLLADRPAMLIAAE